LLQNDLLTRIQIVRGPTSYISLSQYHVNKKANHTETDDLQSRTFICVVCKYDLLVTCSVRVALISSNRANLRECSRPLFINHKRNKEGKGGSTFSYQLPS